jgi:hypothetical protein
MSQNAKLASLLLVTLVATGAVVYQLENRRPARSAVIMPPGDATPAPSGAAAPAPSTIPTAAASATSVTAAPLDPKSRPNIPSGGWARNPFLTLEEIDRLNHPEQPVVATLQLKPAVEPATLPSYALTGIISGGEQGNWAIIDSRTMRAGDHIGSETVKQITNRSVLLDHQGRTRELVLKSIEDTASAGLPKKEDKQ